MPPLSPTDEQLRNQAVETGRLAAVEGKARGWDIFTIVDTAKKNYGTPLYKDAKDPRRWYLENSGIWEGVAKEVPAPLRAIAVNVMQTHTKIFELIEMKKVDTAKKPAYTAEQRIELDRSIEAAKARLPMLSTAIEKSDNLDTREAVKDAAHEVFGDLIPADQLDNFCVLAEEWHLHKQPKAEKLLCDLLEQIVTKRFEEHIAAGGSSKPKLKEDKPPKLDKSQDHDTSKKEHDDKAHDKPDSSQAHDHAKSHAHGHGDHAHGDHGHSHSHSPSIFVPKYEPTVELTPVALNESGMSGSSANTLLRLFKSEAAEGHATDGHGNTTKETHAKTEDHPKDSHGNSGLSGIISLTEVSGISGSSASGLARIFGSDKKKAA